MAKSSYTTPRDTITNSLRESRGDSLPCAAELKSSIHIREAALLNWMFKRL